jgi:hypothetical protein
MARPNVSIWALLLLMICSGQESRAWGRGGRSPFSSFSFFRNNMDATRKRKKRAI